KSVIFVLILTPLLETVNREQREEQYAQQQREQPWQHAVVGLRGFRQEEEAAYAHGDQDVGDSPPPRRFEAYPGRKRVERQPGQVPRKRGQQDAGDQLRGEQGVEVAPQHERLHGGQHGQRRKPDAHHQQDHLPLRERQVQGEFQTLVGHLGNELHQRQQDAQQHGQVLEDVDEDDLLFEHDFPDVGSPLEGYYALNPQQG